ncbi:hypothetical protein E2C01_091871 [Portunus trituberculatus]|uniref:Uncharacterized protein n=1 Tax=Portunus trituberculatus TaxID=210409 RepID=A0A5B7JQ87_PORTR|nr:hypothetical protein [Portunus trituberculatus]
MNKTTKDLNGLLARPCNSGGGGEGEGEGILCGPRAAARKGSPRQTPTGIARRYVTVRRSRLVRRPAGGVMVVFGSAGQGLGRRDRNVLNVLGVSRFYKVVFYERWESSSSLHPDFVSPGRSVYMSRFRVSRDDVNGARAERGKGSATRGRKN